DGCALIHHIALPQRRQSGAGRTAPRDAEYALGGTRCGATRSRAASELLRLAQRRAETEVCRAGATAVRRARAEPQRYGADVRPADGRRADATDRAECAAHQGPALKPRGFAEEILRDGSVPDGVVPETNAGDAGRASRRRRRSS